MADQTFVLGDIVMLDAPFTVNGVPTTPAGATCTIKQPDGTLVSPSTSTPVTGTVHAEFTPVQSGIHAVRIVGTGAAAGAHEHVFYVHPSLVLP